MASGLLATLGLAQKEANYWYFGNNAGMHFTSGSPSVLSNGALVTWEGCATVSDKNGNLRFYTNGVTVWNRNHQVMTNGTGLLGHISTSQSALIVPNPLDQNIYYIFTADYQGNSNGFRYSVVNMTLSGGLGAVTSKNNFLATPVSEKITGAKHQNHVDYWVVTHGWQNDLFYAYKVTGGGVSPSPVVSAVGSMHDGQSSNAIGCMRISANGRKLAVALRDTFVEVFDFDRSTGKLSNPIQLYAAGSSYHYGVEFNMDGTLLYVSTLSHQRIYQYDLTKGSQAAIQASQTQVGMTSASSAGTLQMAPDGKIYMAQWFGPYIGAIEYPDVVGTGSSYVDQAVYLNGNLCYLGLPNFINTIFYVPHVTSEFFCLGDSTEFILNNTADVDSVHWNFDDPLSGNENTSSLFEPKHVFTDTGTYYVKATIFCGPYTAVLDEEVVIEAPPEVNLGADTVLCTGTTLLLDATSPGSSYVWQDGSTDSVFLATTAGAHYVQATNTCGVGGDTIVIGMMTPPVVDLGNDTTICSGDALLLDATSPNSYYTWSNGSSDSAITVNQPGSYHVAVANQCGITQDSILITTKNAPEFSLGSDTGLCVGQSLLLNVTSPGASYLWSDGTTQPIYLVTGPGVFWVIVSNDCGATVDTILIQQGLLPAVNLGPDTMICQGSALLLDAFSPGAIYVWQDGSSGSLMTASLPMTYWVDVTNACGTVRDSLVLQTITVPNVNLGQDTTLCTGDSLLLSAAYPGASYLWNDSTTQSNYLAAGPGAYWVIVSNACGATVDTIVIQQVLLPAVSLGPDTTICQGSALLLNAFSQGATYAWQDGSSGSVMTASLPMTYWVDVTNACGTVRDSLILQIMNVPTVHLGQDTALCSGDSVTLSAAYPGASYLWQNGSQLPSQTAYPGGMYWVDVTNMCGTGRDTLSVAQLLPPAVHLGNDTSVCDGDQLMLNAQHPLSSYSWSTGSTSSTIAVSAAGTYSVVVTNQCGVTADTLTLSVIHAPSVDLGPDQSICEGTSVTLVAHVSGASLVWQDGSTQNTFTTSVGGLYYVTASNVCGTASDAVLVTTVSMPSVSAGPDLELCTGDSVLVDATSTDVQSYLWNDGVDVPVRTIWQAGVYWISVGNACGSVSDTITITERPNPVVDLGHDTVLCWGETLSVSLMHPGCAYSWSHGATSSSIQITEPGLYAVTVTDNIGCVGHDDLSVDFECDAVIEVPTAFTPNDAPPNDAFQVYGTSTDFFEVRIFNRWGERIFESTDFNFAWDGTYRGVPLPIGVYVYFIRYRDYDGAMKELQGSVTLIR
jgi:gliding motility-associated-like protein